MREMSVNLLGVIPTHPTTANRGSTTNLFCRYCGPSNDQEEGTVLKETSRVVLLYFLYLGVLLGCS